MPESRDPSPSVAEAAPSDATATKQREEDDDGEAGRREETSLERERELLARIAELEEQLRLLEQAYAEMEKKLALKETELEAALEKARSDEAKAAERTSDNGSNKAIEELTKALMEAQAEAARLRKLNEELQTALDEARLHGTAGDAAKASKLVAELRKQIEDLKRLLAESQERERHANEKLAGALAQLQAQLDKDDEVDMQRVQWEREKRSELSGLVKDTRRTLRSKRRRW